MYSTGNIPKRITQKAKLELSYERQIAAYQIMRKEGKVQRALKKERTLEAKA